MLSTRSSQVVQWGKNPPASAGAACSSPGSGRSPGEGNGNPLQGSCLEIFIDQGAWRGTVHGVAESQTCVTVNTHTHMLTCTHACTRTHTMHTHTHMHAQTRTHTHTHTQLRAMFPLIYATPCHLVFPGNPQNKREKLRLSQGVRSSDRWTHN